MEEGTGQARLQGEQLRPAPVLLAFLGVLTALHVVYLSLSTAPPSWDEAHYMSGAIGIERGLRSGTLRGAWDGYVTALGFKPPLIAVPAAFLMLVLGEGIFPSMVSLALIFMAIGIATWSLVRNILPPAQAALATALLCTAPMVTGLTHRFFVEGLLLLIAVAYLDALLRHPWDRIGWAAVAGALLGLGALTKLTFLALLFPSTVYLLFARARIVLRDGPKGRALALLGARACLMLLVAFAIAWPWYSRNWRGTVEHSRTFFWAESCAYPALGSFLSNVSSGPSALVFVGALVGLAHLVKASAAGELAESQRRGWGALLILTGATVIATTASVNKATRLSVTWLPGLAALAAFGFLAQARRPAQALIRAGLASGLMLLLVVHNSFGILPVPKVGIGDLKIVDSEFPLNVPDWFQDNHPLDRRRYPVTEVVDVIARDMSARLGKGARADVRLTVDVIVVNHDLMNLLAMLRGDGASYMWWRGAEATGPKAPQYVLQSKGFERFHPGTRWADDYPDFDVQVASGKLPYREVAVIPGPEGSEIVVFRNRALDLSLGDARK